MNQRSFLKQNRLGLLISLFLFSATAVLYSPVKDFDFILLDDDVYITENPFVRAGLTSEGFIYAFTNVKTAGLWQPLVWLSLMVDSELYGTDWGKFHLTNVFFHAINVVLLFLALLRLTSHLPGALWRSALVAALFAVHPLNVESVAWMTERKDVLSTFFGLLTLLAYVRYSKKHSSICYGIALGTFILALMSKVMLVTLPFVLLLLDFWPLDRLKNNSQTTAESFIHQARRLVGEKIPFFILSISFSFFTFFSAKDAIIRLDAVPMTRRVAHVLVAYVNYIGRIFWPVDLTILYPFIDQITVEKTLSAEFLLAGITALAIYSARKTPGLLVGWLWFLGTLVPVIGLVQAGTQGMADRYGYIPYIGLFLMMAWSLPTTGPKFWANWRFRIPLTTSVAGLVLGVLAVMTWRQTQYWRDTETLFAHSLAVTKDNYLIHNNYGLFLDQRGNSADAKFHYLKAIEIKPRYARTPQ